MEYSDDLAVILSGLGMRRVFDPRLADLLADGEQVAVRQQGDSQDDAGWRRNGTVATAATAIIAVQSASVIAWQPLVTRVDHPFLCAIHDDSSGALLFLGCVRISQRVS